MENDRAVPYSFIRESPRVPKPTRTHPRASSRWIETETVFGKCGARHAPLKEDSFWGNVAFAVSFSSTARHPLSATTHSAFNLQAQYFMSQSRPQPTLLHLPNPWVVHQCMGKVASHTRGCPSPWRGALKQNFKLVASWGQPKYSRKAPSTTKLRALSIVWRVDHVMLHGTQEIK